MNIRVMAPSTLACVLLATSAVFAQSPDTRTVAKLANPEMTVLVSQSDAMVLGVKDQRLRPGTRIVTTAASGVTISYDKGCDVRVPENSRFTVGTLRDCKAMNASVESISVGRTVSAGAAAVSDGKSTLAGLGTLKAARGAGIAGDAHPPYHPPADDVHPPVPPNHPPVPPNHPPPPPPIHVSPH